MADDKIKVLLENMKRKEIIREDSIKQKINEILERINLEKEQEKATTISNIKDLADRETNNFSLADIQQMMDQEMAKIEDKYNSQFEESRSKLLAEAQKEKTNDYRQIGNEIKSYHLDMHLESVKEQKELDRLKAERDFKMQQKEAAIKEKEKEKAYISGLNSLSSYSEVEENRKKLEKIDAEIEGLKKERNAIESEYSGKIDEQNKALQYCLEQKGKAEQFLDKIRLSEKSIDEICAILGIKIDVEAIKEDVAAKKTVAEEAVVKEGAAVVEEAAVEEAGAPKKEKLVVSDERAKEAKEMIKRHVQKYRDEGHSNEEIRQKMHKIIEKNSTGDKYAEYLKRLVDEEIGTPTPAQEENGKPNTGPKVENELGTEGPTQEAPVIVTERLEAKEKHEPVFVKNENIWERIARQQMESEVEPKAAIDKIKVYITKDGIAMQTKRYGRYEGGNEKTEFGISVVQEEYIEMAEQEIDPELLKTAKALGDKFVIREILLNLDGKEHEEQLRKYIEVLGGEHTQDSPFEINYYLKDIRKASLPKEERKALIDNAKKIRDLNKKIQQETGTENALGTVDVSLATKAKWLWQDSRLGKWFNKNLLPKGKETPVQEETVAEEPAAENPDQTRVTGVEKVNVDVAKVVAGQGQGKEEEEKEFELL